MGDFNEHQLDLAVNTPSRNALIVEKYQEHAAGKRAVAFCVTVNHAQALAYTFNDAGINAAVIEGDTPLEERQRTYKDFQNGIILILCNVMILTEGWDEPLCEVAIMARPTQSRVLFVQQFGRILRLAPGKECALLLDISDNCLKHRLMPQNLRRILNKDIQDGETLVEALERAEEEKQKRAQEARNTQMSKLKEQRPRDIQINLLEVFEWKDLPNGGWRIVVGSQHHRIAIIPCKGRDNQFYVVAKLAPNFERQKWSDALSLEDAQQLAEKKILTLHHDGPALVDLNASWRSKPVDMESAQVRVAQRFKIEVRPNMAKGQLSDLIDQHKDEIAKRKKAKAARQTEKEQNHASERANVLGALNGNHEFNLMRKEA